MGGPAIIDGECHQETCNFQICQFFVDGLEYSSVECYFQAAKATTEKDRDHIRLNGKTGILALELGRCVKIRSDWEEVKVDEMYKGNKAKFEQNKDFVEKLCITTGPVKFEESNVFWNYWNGKIMERLRAEFRNTEEDKKVAAEINLLMEKYRIIPSAFQ